MTTTTDTDTADETAAFALLSDADAEALETAHESRMAQIAADAATAIDAAFETYFAARDRLEAAAHASLLAHLATRRQALALLEAAAAAPGEADAKVPTPVAAATAADQTISTEEPAMTDAKPAESAAIAPAAEIIAQQKPTAEPAPITPPVVADASGCSGGRALVALAASTQARRRMVETAYLARTADRRADHAAALADLAIVEAKIADLVAAGADDTAASPRTTRRRAVAR
jgi:hypothetical protein